MAEGSPNIQAYLPLLFWCYGSYRQTGGI